MNNANSPAFPSQIAIGPSGDMVTSEDFDEGLTKREHFAGLAMQGVLSDSHIMDLIRIDSPSSDSHTAAFVAGLSVEYADALLAELEKENGHFPLQPM